MTSTSNITSLSGPFSKDLIMAFPRMVARAGSFAFVTVPERIDSMLGFRNGGSMIAEATGNGTWHMISEALSSSPLPGSAVSTASAASATAESLPRGLHSLSMAQVRNFGGIFTYMTSKWALTSFTLVSVQFVMRPKPTVTGPLTDRSQAIILNRTQIYSAARRHINLAWSVRLALRITPILLFLHHTLNLLQAMRCQTSPDFSHLKYGNVNKKVALDFSGDGGFLYWLSSTLLFWKDDAGSCLAVDLIPSKSQPWERKGSLSLLWPLFRSLCLGQFVETISCAVQGKPLMTETGMSIFEHSLAFAEAEAMISNRLGLSWLGSLTGNSAKPPPEDEATVTRLFTRTEILDKMNTSPEILLMGIISSLNNLSSQLLGVLNMQARFRLVNTGFWGLCFMSAFVWGFSSLRPESVPEAIVLRFPTVCIVGFIPHLLILTGIIICGLIYCLALLLCFISYTGPSQSLSDRFRIVRENMQANAQLTNIRLDMHEDFYTALLKIGFSALTVASEAVYLNEGQRISVARLTWLEEERLKEIEAFEHSNDPSRRLGIHLERPKQGDVLGSAEQRPWKSGYDNMTTVKAVRGPRIPDSRAGADGIGHMQRGGRWLTAGQFFRSIFWLFVNWFRVLMNLTLDAIGIAQRPQWLKRQNREKERRNNEDSGEHLLVPEFLQFWMLSDDGVLESPKDNDVDVAYEMRKRQQNESGVWGEKEERVFESSTYDWWKNGGWFGEKDESGFYQASLQDNDTTSIISASTTASETDDECSTHIDSGVSTPTQRHPYRLNRSVSPTPSTDYADNALEPDHLARLLDPRDKEERSEARMLAHHLTAPRVTTRSQYRQAQSSANIKLLASSRYRSPNSTLPTAGPLSPDEEAEVLEQLILTQRTKPLPAEQSSNGWRDGASGMGQGGPQCVVCQSAPRTVLAWPCRCLSLCEECRVSLAMNNFGTCVCCRQDVVGFSRLYVP